MPVSLSFELSDKDLQHFRDMMNVAVEGAQQRSEEEIISKAKQSCEEMEKAELPEFVATRLASLKALITAVSDPEWQMPEDEKQDVLTSLAYFCDPHDLVPDDIPVLGLVDDAIMIELVIQDLSLDLDAYEEFSAYRETEEKRRGDDAHVDRESWLDLRRREIHSELRRKRSSGIRSRIFSRRR